MEPKEHRKRERKRLPGCNTLKGGQEWGGWGSYKPGGAMANPGGKKAAKTGNMVVPRSHKTQSKTFSFPKRVTKELTSSLLRGDIQSRCLAVRGGRSGGALEGSARAKTANGGSKKRLVHRGRRACPWRYWGGNW